MAQSYDDAVAVLFQAPHERFVEERKRLSAELKASGDKACAARLAKLGRPTISAWAVNQLWWHARDAFDSLLEAAEALREGGIGAAAPHRNAIAKLRALASKILGDAGHPASEATLRRVTTTLAALAVTGGFAPDPPGALSADRDPPGFEAAGPSTAPLPPTPKRPPDLPSSKRPTKRDSTEAEAGGKSEAKARDESARTQRELAETKRRHEAEQARKEAEAAVERRRIEKEHAKREAERKRLEGELRTAKDELATREREVEQLRKGLAKVEDSAKRAATLVEQLETRLASI